MNNTGHLYNYELITCITRRFNQVTFQLKLQTFPFEENHANLVFKVVFSLNQVLES